jgi:hypothetical protein
MVTGFILNKIIPPLSYPQKCGAECENRTRARCLGSNCSTTKPIPHQNQSITFCHHVFWGVVVAGAGGTTTITSSPSFATPKASRMAASWPRGVWRVSRSFWSAVLRASRFLYCVSVSPACCTANCAFPTKPKISDPSQRAGRTSRTASIPCLHIFARMWPV